MVVLLQRDINHIVKLQHCIRWTKNTAPIVILFHLQSAACEALSSSFFRFVFTTNEIHFICGGKYCRYRRHKNAPSNSKENQAIPSRQEPALHSRLGKGGSVICRILYDQGVKFSPNPPAWWVKKCYPLLFSKYEIHRGRHLYRIHRKASSVYPQAKKQGWEFAHRSFAHFAQIK